MQAFALDEVGKPGSLRELPTPQPQDGQVLVRVHAAGVNPFDVWVTQGYVVGLMEHRFPLIPGVDAAGVVEAVGDKAGDLAVGDEVFGFVGKPYVGEGTYAQAVTMSAGSIARKPASLDFRQAAAVPLAGATALTLLDAVDLASGQTVLVIGASGGVGSFFVQLAAERGATVVGICSGPNVGYVRERRAADVIDYTRGDVGEALQAHYPGGVDAVVDLAGDKAELNTIARQLRRGTRLASAAMAADEAQLAERGIKAVNTATAASSAHMERLARGLDDGTLRLPEIHALPLGQAADALAQIATRHTRGKLILDVA
jgi:NADPH:quinone reductase-like Zn-dependent oxidoreductase